MPRLLSLLPLLLSTMPHLTRSTPITSLELTLVLERGALTGIQYCTPNKDSLSLFELKIGLVKVSPVIATVLRSELFVIECLIRMCFCDVNEVNEVSGVVVDAAKVHSS